MYEMECAVITCMCMHFCMRVCSATGNSDEDEDCANNRSNSYCSEAESEEMKNETFLLEEELIFSHRHEKSYDLADARYQAWLNTNHPSANQISGAYSSSSLQSGPLQTSPSCFPSFFCPPLISSSPFPLSSFLFSFSYSFPIPFLSFSSLFLSLVCCFSFSLSSLFFIHLISSSFSHPLSFSLFLLCFFCLALKFLSCFMGAAMNTKAK